MHPEVVLSTCSSSRSWRASRKVHSHSHCSLFSLLSGIVRSADQLAVAAPLGDPMSAARPLGGALGVWSGETDQDAILEALVAANEEVDTVEAPPSHLPHISLSPDPHPSPSPDAVVWQIGDLKLALEALERRNRVHTHVARSM